MRAVTAPVLESNQHDLELLGVEGLEHLLQNAAHGSQLPTSPNSTHNRQKTKSKATKRKEGGGLRAAGPSDAVDPAGATAAIAPTDPRACPHGRTAARPRSGDPEPRAHLVLTLLVLLKVSARSLLLLVESTSESTAGFSFPPSLGSSQATFPREPKKPGRRRERRGRISERDGNVARRYPSRPSRLFDRRPQRGIITTRDHNEGPRPESGSAPTKPELPHPSNPQAA